MSVPFSNTHLRVPRGFGTILEGLVREVLRDQPEDIRTYAAQYFEALLKKRQESGMDPAEWAAKLEDRFYNNHAFKAHGASPEKDPAPGVTSPEKDPAQGVTSPKKDPAQGVTSPKKDPAPEVTSPKKDPAPEVTSPEKDPAPGVTSPKKDPAPGVTSPEKDPAPGVTSPKKDPAQGVTSPEKDPAPEVTSPKKDPAPEVTSPEKDPAPGVTSPKKDPAPGVTSPEKDPAPGVTSPKKDPAPGVTSPEKDPAPGVTSPKKDPAPGVTSPEKDPASGVTSPKKDPAPGVTSPEKDPAPGVTSPEKDPAPEVTSPKKDPAPGVTSPEKDPAQGVTSPEKDPAPGVTSPKKDPAPGVTSPEKDPAPGVTSPEKDPAPGVTSPEKDPAPGVTSPEKDPAPEVTSPNGSKTANESSRSAEASELSTTQPNVSEEGRVTETTEEEEDEDEERDVAEGYSASMKMGLSEGELINSPPTQSDGRSVMEEHKDPAIYTANEKDISSAPDQDLAQSASAHTLLFSGLPNVDVCAQELEATEDNGGDKQEAAVVEKEIEDSGEEENTEGKEPHKIYPHSGLADVDICATELRGPDERATSNNGALSDEEESFKLQPEETLAQSSLSQFETPEDNQQEAEDLAEKTMEEEGTETKASFGETHESVAHIEGVLDGDMVPKEDPFVEISFEDVPEAQQITEAEEQQPEDEGSVEVSQSEILEMQQGEEPKDVTAVSTDQNVSGQPRQDESETGEVGTELNCGGEEMESHFKVSDIMQEEVATNGSNLNDGDEDKGEGEIKSSPSDQPATENTGDETDCITDDNEKIREGTFLQSEISEKETESNDADFKEEETTHTVVGDKEDRNTEGHIEEEDEDINDDKNKVTPSNTAETERESETQHLSEAHQGTRVESRPEKTGEEAPSEDGANGAEEEGRSGVTYEEESRDITHVADGTDADRQGEEIPLASGADTRETEEEKFTEEEECSRPQEEEDIMDIPLDDPEANRAAAKIQAGFRGHMTRKKMKPEDKAEGEERQEDRGQ